MGLAGYSFKGVYEQVQKARGSKATKAARTARISQGLEEWEAATEEEKNTILRKTKEDLVEFEQVLRMTKTL